MIIGFLNKKVGAFLSDIDGYANGTAYIIGGWRRIDLAGSLALHCSTRVKANNVVYSFMGDTESVYMLTSVGNKNISWLILFYTMLDRTSALQVAR